MTLDALIDEYQSFKDLKLLFSSKTESEKPVLPFSLCKKQYVYIYIYTPIDTHTNTHYTYSHIYINLPALIYNIKKIFR